MGNDNLKNVYDTLKKEGFTPPEYDVFVKDMQDENNLKGVYNSLKESGYTPPEFDVFASDMGVTAQQPAQTAQEPSETPTQISDEDKQQLLNKTNAMMAQAGEQVSDFNQHVDNVQEYGLDLNFGKTKQGKKVFNNATGKFEDTFITPVGNRYTNKAVADIESRQYRERTANVSVGAQLRNAYKERDAIMQQLDEIARREDEQNDSNLAQLASASNVTGGLFYSEQLANKRYTDDEYKKLHAALGQIDERISTLEDENDRQQGVDVGFWRGFGKVTGDARTWDLGLRTAMDASAMLDRNDNETEGEQQASDAMMQQAAKNQEAQAKYGNNADFWNRAGVMTGHMPAFMLDFIMTGGGFSGINLMGKAGSKLAVKAIGKEVIDEMAKQGFKSYVKANGLKGLGREIGAWTIKAMGTTADDLIIRAPLMTNTIQAGKTGADIIDRKLGDVIQREDGTLDFSNDKTWGSAIWQGEASNIIENYSEMFGAHLDPVLSAGNLAKVANAFGAKRLGGVLAKADAGALGGIMGQTNSFFQKMGVSDYFGEVSEEYYGQLWRTMLNLDDAYIQNPDGSRTNLFMNGQFHGDIWGGMALSMGMMGAGKGVMTAANYAGMKHSVNIADSQARELLGDDVWEPIRTTLDTTTNDNIGEVAESIINDNEMSNDEKSAVMNYLERSMNLRGFNLAETVSKRGFEVDEDKEEANEAWSDGYNMTTSAEMQDAKNMMEIQRNKLAAQLGIEPESLDNEIGDPLTFLREQRELGAPDEELTTVVDYVNAKYVFDGMQQRADDEVESQIATSNAMVDARTNRKDGMVHPATMQVDDRQVYILDGNIVLTDDGTMVDHTSSDESIVIKDAKTGKVEIASPESILSISEPVNASEEKMVEEQRIREQASLNYERNVNGLILEYEPGATYTLTDASGRPFDITITANEQGVVDNGDGTVNVLTDTGEVQPLEKELIQLWYNNTNMQRVSGYEAQLNEEESQETNEAPVQTAPTYAANDEFILRDEDGTEKRAIIQGRRSYDAEKHDFVPDENGSIIEYYVEGEDHMRYSYPSLLEDIIVSYQTPATQEEDAVSTSPVDESTTEEPIEKVEEETPTEETAPVQEAMPMTKDGDPDYYAATPTRTRSFIYDEAGLERTEANEHVNAQLDTATKALDKAKNASLPKMGTSIKQYNEAKAKRQQKIEEAQKVVDFWSQVKNEQNAIVAAERAEQAQRDAEQHDEAVKQVEAEREAQKIADAERAAVGNENPMPVISEKWNKAIKQDGMQDEIVLPNGERIKGHYVLHEAGASSPSHQSSNGFQKTEGFPMDESGNTVNDRDYEGDSEAQRVTRDIAGNYDQRALQTPIVVSQDGVVLSGNGRTMAGELAAQGGTDTAYNEYLKQYAAKYGFTPEQVEQMQHPRVAFVPDEAMPYTTETFAKFNQQEMKSQNKTEHAVKLGKTVSDDSFGRIIRAINHFDTLGDFYNDAAAGAAAVKELVSAGVIPQAQVAEMMDGNKLSAVGRETLENVLIGKSFEGDPNAVRMLSEVPSMRQSIIFALSEISNNLSLGNEYTLKDELTEAIKLCYEARTKGKMQYGEAVSAFARQGDLFASPDEVQTVADYQNATIMMLADVLNDKRVSQLKKVIASYNDMAIDSANGQLDLFTGELKNREEIIDNVINLLNNGTQEQITAAQQATVERRKESASQNGDGSQGGNAEQVGEKVLSTTGEEQNNLAKLAETTRNHGQDNISSESGSGSSILSGAQSNQLEGTPGTQDVSGSSNVAEHKQNGNGPQSPAGTGQTGNGQRESDSTGMAEHSTPGVESNRNRGDIRVFEEGLDAQRDEYSEYSERARRNAESERLVSVAKENNQYISQQELEASGKKYPKRTGESTVYIQESEGKVYKSKDPYAKAAMKQGVEPEDVIYEHIIHNLLFPETELTFEGISEEMGDVRIVLSQNFVESVGIPTKEEIEQALAEKGLVREDNYFFGNEFVSVTDVEGDNVLKGADGKLYFIDPIIRFKKPVKEIIAALSSQETSNNETVENNDDLTEEERALQDRIYILEKADYEVTSKFGTVHHQPILIASKDGSTHYEIDKVDAPDKHGDYTGSFYVYDGKEYGDLQEVFKVIDNDVAAAEAEVNTNPTEAQKAAGNYKMGHVKIDGYDVTIENPKGSTRSGKDDKGNEWSITMNNTYGYIRGTEGVDGDHIDVFLSDNPEEGDVFVVDQLKKDGTFDEHKVMYGFNSEEEATQAYLANYSPGWKGLGTVTQVSKEDFKKWIESSHRKTKPFADYVSFSRKKANPSSHDDSISSYMANLAENQPKPQPTSVNDNVEDLQKQFEQNGKYYHEKAKEVEELYGIPEEHALNFVRNIRNDMGAIKSVKVQQANTASAMFVTYDKGQEITISFGKQGTVKRQFDNEGNQVGPDGVALQTRDANMDEFIERIMSENMPKKEIAPRMEGYTLEARKDTRDNSDIYAVKFDERVSKDEFKGQKAIAKKFGGYWSNFGKKGFLFKTEEAAHDFAETVMGRTVEEVEDDAPVSMADIAPEAISSETTPVNEEVPSSSTEDPYHTDAERAHYEELKKRMRAKLSQLNAGVDPELLQIGVEMAYFHFKGGMRHFADFCKTMIEDCGNAIRPHLKMLYNAASGTEEFIERGWDMEMDDRKTVRDFDVYNFDKKETDALGTAEHVVAESESMRQGEEIVEQTKTKRNENQRKRRKQEEADRTTVAIEAATTASQARSKIEKATTEQEVAEVEKELDKQLASVDKQLELADYIDNLRPEGKLVLNDGREVQVSFVMHSGEQTSATTMSKPRLDRIYAIHDGKMIDFTPDKVNIEATLQLNEGSKEVAKELDETVLQHRPEEWKDLKVGDKVMYKGQECTVHDFMEYGEGEPSLDTGMAPVIYEVASWEDIQPIDTTKKESSSKPKAKTKKEQLNLFEDLFNQKEDNHEQEKVQLQSGSSTTEREGGHESRQNEPVGKSEQHEVEGADRRRMGGRNGKHSVSDKERSGSVSEQPKSKSGVTEETTSAPKNTRNNVAERGTDYAPKGENARIEANIKALETMIRLIDNGEEATREDMEVMRRFSGWGGLGGAFREKKGNAPWDPVNPHNKKLREILSPEQYEYAKKNASMSQYFTPAAVIDRMWDIARALGFKGGNVLEGSAGIGNILGLMPRDMSANSDIHAVEVDEAIGQMLALLYPDAKVEIQGFEETKVPNGSVDLSITNVPFVTGLSVFDKSGDSDLSKKFRDIHNFCIAKNVRKLREGGIGIFISSNGTLDSSPKLMNWITNEGKSDVVGAFRLHSNTFGGTNATSDIIVVRKRVNGKKSANAIDVSKSGVLRVVPYLSRDAKANEKPKDMALTFNQYFIEHPEYMGGEMAFAFEKGETWQETSRRLYPSKDKDQDELLAQWVKDMQSKDWEASTQEVAPREDTSIIYEDLGNDVKEGTMLLDKEGTLCVAQRGKAVPLNVNANKVKGQTKAQCFKDYKSIKDALNAVLDYQTKHNENKGLEPLLKELNRAYDYFVKTYGNLNKNVSISFLKNDMEFPSVAALESVTERGTKDGKKEVSYGKTDVFKHRVVEKESEPKPTNVKDAIIASIYLNGFVNVPYIAEQLGKSEEDVRKEIIETGLGFENPTTTDIEVSYEYLSGNVREKLAQAREANTNGQYDANIKALEKVVPMNIPAHLIEFTLGSSWVDPKLYEEYIKDRTELNVTLTNAGGTWVMSKPYYVGNEKNKALGVRSEICDKIVYGHELIEAALQNKTVNVTKTIRHYDGETETIVDKEATMACANKIDEIRQDFKDWARKKMQSDPELSQEIERTYNDQFNNYVPKNIDDEFIPEHFGGAAKVVNGKPFSLRKHQAKAAIRATTQPLMLAHEVGTGKTYTLITTAMEMRRLGTAHKPMIVVQNATVGQFVGSAKALYPNARILTLEDADRTAEGRKNFYAKIRYNDWDMIVVPQSVFERIPDSPEREARFIESKIEEKIRVIQQLREAANDNDRDPVVKRAEKELEDLKSELNDVNLKKSNKNELKDQQREAKAKQNASVKAQEMLDRDTDDTMNFDDMGIDALLIDEAHEYKHLGFETAMQRGVKGVDPSYSKKSQGVYLKTQAVMENNNGRNVVFATGTPISNTAAEIWTFMRYLLPEEVMKEYGIFYFDDFVRNFGQIQQTPEFGASGKYKEVNRFMGYVNLPELVRIWGGVADTVLTREAGGVSDKIPEMEGGKAQDIYLPQTKALRSVMKFVKETLDDYEKMSGKEKKENSHIPLVMYGIAKAAAVDARLVLTDAADEPNSKTNESVRQTLKSLEESKKYKGTVAIFADNYQNKKSGFNLYEDIRAKLIEQGVPAEQIVIMKSGMTVKKKLEIFDKVNRGEVRVIMGSTFTLGTGVNIQERLHTLIHVDAPNRPMDYTQRNGRILRQGNLHKEWGIPVRVLRFGVEDSLDVTAYQRLKTKGAIADSIMNGKQMIGDSMNNRVLEEEQDIFGDITAQLSGSQYALLKNQIEKQVKKLESRKSQYEQDQTYIHNQKPRLKGQIAEAKQRKAIAEAALKKVENVDNKEISIGKFHFKNVEAMADFIKDYNSKQHQTQEQIRTGREEKASSTLTVNAGGFDFVINSTTSKELRSTSTGLAYSTTTKMYYTCEELGLIDVPVDGQKLRNALNDIVDDVLSGDDFRERIEAADASIERNQNALEQLEAREGKPFEDQEALDKALEKLDEYEDLMRKELEEKEAKYAEMDKEVDSATDIAGIEEDDDNSYREVSEKQLLSSLREASENGETVKVYRTMQVIDGELYSPMAKKVAGKETSPIKFRWEEAEEHPELAKQGDGSKAMPNKDSFYIVIDKGQGKGSLTVAYNPYTHTSRTVLNDQFSSAFIRPNLVVVEVEVPKSELEGIYHAAKAKDSVGEMSWHSGAVSGKLAELGNPRKVILTRYDKPVRILTKKEEAQMIAKVLEGTDIAMPYNLVTPQVRAELERLGVEISDKASGSVGKDSDFGKAEYVTDEQIEAMNRKLRENAISDPKNVRAAAERLAEELNTSIEIIEDVESITSEDPEKQKRMRNAKGWYNRKTGKVYIVLPNNLDVEDAASTVFHEVVAHKGLRELVGEENYKTFLHEVFEHCKADVRRKIVEKAAKHGWNFEKATDEYLGELAEKGFEDFSSGERSFWEKLKDIVLKAIDKFLKTMRLPKSTKLGDNELRYLLWRSHENLKRGKENFFEYAEDVVKRQELELDEEYNIYREGVSNTTETDDVWNDESLGLHERISAAAARLSNNHADDKTLRNDAVKAINGNLTQLRKAMSLQKKFDQSTVKRVSDLARVLMNYGYLNSLSQMEVKRLLAAVKNSVGHDDIDGSIQKVMDIMVDNQLKNAEDTMHKLMLIKASKVDAKGVQIQGKLDVKGQLLMQVMKKAIRMQETDIQESIADAMNRMSSNDQSVADEAALEYAGLNLALEYVQNITGSKVEEKKLRDELKQSHEEATEEERATESYKQYVGMVHQAIRQNKIDRAEDYYQLVGKITESLRESLENAEAFKEAEKQRIREIQHNANSDMVGRKTDAHRKDSWKDKFMNNSFVSFVFAPMATFDQILRMFGSRSANGEGYLWNRFMRGWVDAREKEIVGVRQKYAELDKKVHEIFGNTAKTMGEAIRLEGKLPKVPVRFWNGGEVKEHELSQGNIMYIYMVNKMLDGRMKLRKMGISEEDVELLEEILDPRYKELADWMQEEFLVETRNEYNKTHNRMFGASMAAIENYFPLKILSNARADKAEDLDNPYKVEGISTSTGSIIKRRRNALALDLLGADALGVILEHVAQMEHWNAYAEWNRDLNTLRTYKHFRNQVQNMTSIYGGGKELWKRFNDLCQMAAGSYRAPRAKLDEAAVNFAKGVSAAKVSFRLFTALKQLLSMPAYLPEARADILAKDIAMPYKAWKWSVDNLPIFKERWASRTSGDPRLMKSDMDWKLWRSRVMEIASRIGMSPNAFVDALTVSIGTHAMYQTKLAQYKKDGYSEEEADRLAKQDATILFNQTQQSSEGVFMSPMQVDRSWLSIMFSVFRNSSMAYTRQLYDAIRNLKRNLNKGNREDSIDFMAKQMLRSGLDEHKAAAAAKRKLRKQIVKDAGRIAVFGYIMQLAWNLGAYLPYLLFGDDDDEKSKMWDDVWAHTMFGSIEGLTGGDVLSLAGSMLVSGEGNPTYLSKDMPLTSDLMHVLKKFGTGKHAEGLSDIINLVVQSGIGVNPQSITDGVLAIIDACGDDPKLANEAAIFVMRLLQVPQSQIEKIYFDEIGLTGEELSNYTPEQLCNRYAQYKVKRGRFNAPWTWDDADASNWKKIATGNVKERIQGLGDKDVNEAYNSIAEEVKPMSEMYSAFNRAKERKNVEEAKGLLSQLQSDSEAYAHYIRFKRLDAALDKLVKYYLQSKTPEEAALCIDAILTYKGNMVSILQADSEQERERRQDELSKALSNFGDKYSKLRQ